MTKEGTLLVVDDNRNILTSLRFLLKDVFARVITLESPAPLPALLRGESIDVVLLDMNFSAGINSGNEGLFWLREIRRLAPQVQVVLFTAYADIDLAVTGIKEGAADFIVKPWDNARLVRTLLGAYARRKDTAKAGKTDAPAPQPDSGSDGAPAMYWGTSQAMRPVRTLVEKVSATDAGILITGENGTGKDLLAREIHRLSRRSGGPLVSVDLGAIPESLFESELFGHVKGAFTDARADRAGRFEAAHGGTLFLDEIANVPYHLQAKLLTALQQKCIVRIGSNRPVATDIRLICATNRNPDELVRQGLFREDLLYRINTIHIHLPALRQRKEDILPLARRFLQQYNARYGRHVDSISPEAARLLTELPWQGNIRELQHTLEKAVILTDGHELQPDVLLPAGTPPPPAPDASAPADESGMQTLEEMECRLIREAIGRCGGNLSQAAAQLGITRQTLYNKMKRYGI